MLQTAVKNEKQARATAEAGTAEAECLRHKLKNAELARDMLEKKLQAMTVEASDWELALDALQASIFICLVTPAAGRLQGDHVAFFQERYKLPNRVARSPAVNCSLVERLAD